MKNKVFGKSVQGASHIRTDTPCQDSLKIFQSGEDTIILAVADGHGNKACPYSDIGSGIAVGVFCDVMKDFGKRYGKKLTTFAENSDKASKTIDLLWKKRIIKEHKSHKRETPSADGREAQKAEIYKMYGTTLVGLFITPDFIFAYQLGDGDIIYADNTGVSREFQIGEKALGTDTYSMSSLDAWKLAKTKFIRSDNVIRPPCMFMLSTDGFANSYKDEREFEKTCIDYFLMTMEHGADAIEANLEEWLTQTSREGCGDDVTLLAAYFE